MKDTPQQLPSRSRRNLAVSVAILLMIVLGCLGSSRTKCTGELVVDGKTVCSLTGADRVCVERADARFQMIEVAGQGYYHNLREKLKWGGGLRLGE